MTLDALVSRAEGVLEEIRACHASLAANPDPKGEREQELLRLIGVRDSLAAELGDGVLAALAAGAKLTVSTVEVPVETELAEPARVVVEPVEPEVPPDSPWIAEAPPPVKTEVAEPVPADDLSGVLNAIGRPQRAWDVASSRAIVRHLMQATANPDQWLVHPQPTQQALIGLTASIARHLQDEGPPLDEDGERSLRAWFSKMTAWSGAYRPGYVKGLSRRNDPERGTWFADAEHWWWRLTAIAEGRDTEDMSYRPEPPARMWVSRPPHAATVEESDVATTETDALRQLEDALAEGSREIGSALDRVVDTGVGQRDPRLLRLLASHRERVAVVSGFKTLKDALKEQARTDPEPDDSGEGRGSAVPAEWPWLSLTEGRSAVIVGGDRRPEAADRIREAFRMAAVDWEETDPRRVASVAGRVRARTIDLLILLRTYIRHADSDVLVDACKDAGVPFVVVDAGYGVSQVRLAIERYLGGALASGLNNDR